MSPKLRQSLTPSSWLLQSMSPASNLTRRIVPTEMQLPETNYDVVVIGSGVGGYTAAIRAGQLGFKTDCIEGAGVLAGTCLIVGCIPSKALLHASELFDLARTKFAGFGIKVMPELDLGTMMSQKQASVDALGHGIEFLFQKNKVDRIDGRARLSGPGRVRVRKPDGAEIPLATFQVITDTGSIP